MAALQCEVCGGKLKGRPGGIYECEFCGVEYDTAWAKAKIQEIQGTVKVEGTVQVEGTVKVQGGINIESLLKRGWLALEDEEWVDATRFFDDALNLDAESAQAYLGKLMAEMKLCTREQFKNCTTPFDDNVNYNKALRFADSDLAAQLKEYLCATKCNIAADIMQQAVTEYDYAFAQEILATIQEYEPARKTMEECIEAEKRVTSERKQFLIVQEEQRKALQYKNTISQKAQQYITDYEEALCKKMNEKVAEIKEKNNNTISKLNESLLERQHKLNVLGFFQIAEKKVVKNEIAQIQQQVASHQAETNITLQIQAWKERMQKAIADYSAVMDEYLNKRFISKQIKVTRYAEVDPSSAKRFICNPIETTSTLLSAIQKRERLQFWLDVIDVDGTKPCSANELYDECLRLEILKDTSRQAAFSTLRQLWNYGLIGKIDNCYCRLDCSDVNTLTIWEEDPEIAKEPFPQPPIQNELFFKDDTL